MNYPIYMDYNATTPVDQRVLDAMLPYFGVHFGNASSRTHVFGLEAEEAVDVARRQVARLLGAASNEVVFTSGATESINLALKGAFEAHSHQRNHIITVRTEHKAVLDTCLHLEKLGAEVTYLQPDSEGLITAEQVETALRPNTLLVSVMAANNEIGVIQPIHEIATLTRQRGILFHTDATQAVGKIPLNLVSTPIDLLSLSAHKLYGPKGVGVLIVRNKTALVAQQDGGRHERNRRSGTLNVPGIVGLGMACELAFVETQPFASPMRQQSINDNFADASEPAPADRQRVVALRDQLEQGILQNIRGTQVNGSRLHRLPNTTNISFEGVEGELLLMSLNDIAVSNGSACNSASTDPSYVLKALGLSDEMAYASVRFSLGRFTTDEDVNVAIRHVTEVVRRLQNC